MKNHTRQEIGAHLHGESPIPPHPNQPKICSSPSHLEKFPSTKFLSPPPTKSQFPPLNNFQVITQ